MQRSDGDIFPSSRTALLTTHFGDPRWVELLLRRIRSVFELDDDRVFVIDQDRTENSSEMLRRLLGPVRMLRFPVSEPHVVMTGHDHAHVLNLAVRTIDSDFLMVFDSDAHPVSPVARLRLAELIRCNDAVLAAKHETGSDTHPCFMVFGPSVDRARLVFDEGQLEAGVDTGRRVFGQVGAMGLRAELLRPEPAFHGRWGTLYLEGSIYHHGSGSFPRNTDPRLRAQAKYWRYEHEFFRHRVLHDHYELSRRELVVARALSEHRRLREQLGSRKRRLTSAAGKLRARGRAPDL